MKHLVLILASLSLVACAKPGQIQGSVSSVTTPNQTTPIVVEGTISTTYQCDSLVGQLYSENLMQVTAIQLNNAVYGDRIIQYHATHYFKLSAECVTRVIALSGI